MDDQTRTLPQPYSESCGMKDASSMRLESQISSTEFLQHRQEHGLWAHLWTQRWKNASQDLFGKNDSLKTDCHEFQI